MLQVSDLSMMFSDKKLFENVTLSFYPGNCYGIIGANGAGKSTFLKILAGDRDASTGQVIREKNTRMSVLRQDHFMYNEFTPLETVLQGNAKLYEVLKEREYLYSLTDFTEEQGMRMGEIEGEFADLGGYTAESEAQRLLAGLGVPVEVFNTPLKDIEAKDKVKTLLAQALFGEPDLLIMDEPTNHLDMKAIRWLEDFLLDFEKTVIVVSHDSSFLNTVCTHTVDIDFGEARMYTGNYDFWMQSSQLAKEMTQNSNAKKEQQIKQLQDFVARFSANASKARQATSRKKLLDKISLDEIKPSTRKYPFIGVELCRDLGKDILMVNGMACEPFFKPVTFSLNQGDKVVVLADDDNAATAFLEVLLGKVPATAGEFKWGVTVMPEYFPKDNTAFFTDAMGEMSMIDWLRQYKQEETDSYLRGFLGRMLFSGDTPLKKVKVCSGGEKVRLMFSRLMMVPSNCLIIDQPTNHLDMESIESVSNGLAAYKGILIFTDHNKGVIEKVANKIIDIKKDGTVIYFDGPLDEYLEKM